jgi:ceramide glucosyltransferase
VSLAALAGAHVIGATPWIAAAATLTGWFLLESLLCLVKGWPISLWSPPAFIGREVLSLLVRLHSLTTRDITWGGGPVHVNRKPAP